MVTEIEYRLLRDKEVKGLRFPPGNVLADWPGDCLLLGTCRKSPTSIVFWRRHTHGFIKATSLPKYSPKRRVNFQRCQWNGINKHYLKQNYMTHVKWLIIKRIGSLWNCRLWEIYVPHPSIHLAFALSWKQAHTSGSQTPPGEYRKPLHPFFP